MRRSIFFLPATHILMKRSVFAKSFSCLWNFPVYSYAFIRSGCGWGQSFIISSKSRGVFGQYGKSSLSPHSRNAVSVDIVVMSRCVAMYFSNPRVNFGLVEVHKCEISTGFRIVFHHQAAPGRIFFFLHFVDY